jgi:hypothetical protein
MRTGAPQALWAGTRLADPNLGPGAPTLESDLELGRGAGGNSAVNPSAGRAPTEVYDPGRKRSEAASALRLQTRGLPVVMEFLARPFDEARLFAIASAPEPARAIGIRRRDFEARLEAPGDKERS